MKVTNIALGIATATLSIGAIANETQAATITSLYNTGVDSSGVVRTANGTLSDLHYSIISSPSGAVGTQINNYPAWIGANTTSAWIGPVGDTSVNGPTGLYTYRTTFDLSGFNPSTASISGKWSTDNNGIRVLLNGVDTGVPATSFTQFSSGFASFNISSGFVSGINTLDFVVNNGGGPTGLRTELLGTATATASVPEPFTIVGTIIGTAAAFRLRKRFKATNQL